MRVPNIVCLVVAGVFMFSPARAQDVPPVTPGEPPPAAVMDHSVMTHSAPAPSSAVNHYAEAMEKMHKDMMVAPTGDADVDFVQAMIPHHQGAIDMAKIVIERGKDPELKRLAQDIVAAQEREISMMKSWLQAHGR